jgi:hypothetical protein
MRTLSPLALALVACSAMACGGRVAVDEPVDGDIEDTFVDLTDARPPPFDSSIADSILDHRETFVPDSPPDEGIGFGDVAPPVPDRRLNVLFAQPDAPPFFVCVGAFASDPLAAVKPVAAIGPMGIMDPAAPADPTKMHPYPYGSYLPYVVTEPAAKAAFTSLNTVVYFLTANPLVSTPSSTCADQWAAVRTDPKRWFSMKPGTITAGRSFLLSLNGCAGPSSTGECGPGTADTRSFAFAEVSAKDPPSYVGVGATRFGAQFFHASQFAGTGGVPSLQGIDVYLQCRTTDGTPSGKPIQLTNPSAATSYGDLSPLVGAAIDGDPNEALFLVTPHGAAPCASGTGGCSTISLPAGRYLTAYASSGGGFLGNQTIALIGTLLPSGGTPPKIFMAFLPQTF